MMASPSAPSFPSTKETTNYARLCRLLVDVGSDVLRDTFDKKRPPGNLNTVLSSSPVHKVLQQLKKKKVLKPPQWNKLYSVKSSVSSKNFDITLLMVLLRSICNLVPPPTGWDELPLATDTTLEADIVRIKYYRNTIHGHASQASVDDSTFNQHWQDIQGSLVRLGGAGYQVAIDDLKKACMDPEWEEHYRELLKQWVMDEVSIMERQVKFEENLFRKPDERKESMVNLEKETGVEAVARYTNALKDSIKTQTEFFPLASPTSSKVRTDDIFTSLQIQHGRKPVEDSDMEREEHPVMKRKEHLQQYGRGSRKPVEHSQEIFLSETGREDDLNPNSVLVTGKAGIGKTLFCQNLIRDWANNKLFQPQRNGEVLDFKFAYLLTFRQLSLLKDKSFSLREILNRSTVLDEHSNIDESLFKYIVDHSREVLIILDGFDEYSQRNQSLITGDWDDQYPNSVKEKMPVAALCAKLIKGKILKDSVVMMTSRPDESDQMTGKIDFDRYVDITGFSEQQVKRYIEKYFKGNEVIKNAVMNHITKNDDLVSFAHIPVLCFLLCSYFEYILNKSMSTDTLPASMGEIYSEVINVFLRTHGEKKGAPVEKTLDKLSEFAAHLLRKGKFLFSVDDDMRSFSPEEVESLKASGLLHCGPMFRKSFSESTKYFCFTHLTVQEYLAACWFVKQRKIPPHTENAKGMVLQFMSGILSKQNDQAFIRKLLERLIQRNSFLCSTEALTLKCLAEYRDKEFAQIFVKEFYGQFQFCGTIMEFDDVDCNVVSFLLEVISSLNAEEKAEMNQPTLQQSRRSLGNRLNLFRRAVPCAGGTAQRSQTSYYSLCRNSAKMLWLYDCRITQTGLRQICEALKSDFPTITDLTLNYCSMAEEWVATIAESLPLTNVTTLCMTNCQITDAVVVSLCQALQKDTFKVTELSLKDNAITDAGAVSLCQALQTATCQVTTLDLSGNQVTDFGVASLCQALQIDTCKVSELSLNYNEITDAGAVNLWEALQAASCKLTDLSLRRNQITNACVASVCQSVDLGYNEITDAGVISLCQALQTPTCKATTLNLDGNKITDAGVISLCQALQSPACQVTTLNLGYNQITNAGVGSLCQTLQTVQCQVTSLELWGNSEITSAGKRRLTKLLKQNPGLELYF